MTKPALDAQLRTLVDSTHPLSLADLSGRIVVHKRSVPRRKFAAVVVGVALATTVAFVIGARTTAEHGRVTTPPLSTTEEHGRDSCGPPSCARTPEQAAPLLGFAPLLPTYLPDGWLLSPAGTVHPYASLPSSAPGVVSEPSPTYTIELGPQDVMVPIPDGRFQLANGAWGVLMMQRTITPSMNDSCAGGSIPSPPTVLVLDSGMTGCVVDITAPVAGAPETHTFWFRRNGIEILVIANSVPDAEIVRIAQSMR